MVFVFVFVFLLGPAALLRGGGDRDREPLVERDEWWDRDRLLLRAGACALSGSERRGGDGEAEYEGERRRVSDLRRGDVLDRDRDLDIDAV